MLTRTELFHKNHLLPSYVEDYDSYAVVDLQEIPALLLPVLSVVKTERLYVRRVRKWADEYVFQVLHGLVYVFCSCGSE